MFKLICHNKEFNLFDTEQNKLIWPKFLSYIEVVNKYRKHYGIKGINIFYKELDNAFKNCEFIITEDRKQIYLFEKLKSNDTI